MPASTFVSSGRPYQSGSSVARVRVERASGVTLIERQLPGSQKLTPNLEPGAYRLASWQRICDVDCGNLDPPGNRCARPFTVRNRQQLEATARVDFASGCVIVLR
jgi:hypothetical protein